MALTAQEEQLAFERAREHWWQTNSVAIREEVMMHNVYFQCLLRQERDLIEASHASSSASGASHPSPAPRTTQPPQPQPQSPQRCDEAIATCPFAPETSRAEGETRNCGYSFLQVNKNGDSDRIYRSNRSSPHRLEIVAGRERSKATVEFRLNGAQIVCDIHNHRVWNVRPAISGANITQNTSLDLSLGWAGNTSQLGFFNSHIQPSVYHIRAASHSQSRTVQVFVYPDYAWSGNVSVNFRIEPGTGNIRYDGIGVQLQRTDDGVTTQFGGRIAQIIDTISRFLGFVQQAKQIAQTVVAGAVTWNVVPPSFQISIDTKWQENPTNLLCGYYVNASMQFSPLIGIQFTANLGIIAIQAIPYIGRLVAGMAGDAISRYISITFTMTGTIGVNCTYSREITSEHGQFTGGVTGQVGLDFQIRGQVNREFSFFAVNCGLRGGARATVTAQVRGPLLDMQGGYLSVGANFDGLVVYAGAFCRAGVGTTTQQHTPSQTYRGGYTGDDGRYQVSNHAQTISGETSGDAPSATEERTWTWIAARPLFNEQRIRL